MNSCDACFTKSAFANALIAQGICQAQDGDFVRSMMQHLKHKGQISYDADSKQWQQSSFKQAPEGQAVTPTLLAPQGDAPNSLIPSATILSARLSAVMTIITGFTRALFAGLAWLIACCACLALILSLISLNANFAWQLGEQAPQLRYALTAALIALDVLRPLLVIRSLGLAARGCLVRATLALMLALSLAACFQRFSLRTCSPACTRALVAPHRDSSRK